MKPIDIVAIERNARDLRAAELRRVENLIGRNLRLYGELSAGSLIAALGFASALLRPWFAWNPQARQPGGALWQPWRRLFAGINQALRSLFSWNPQRRRYS